MSKKIKFEDIRKGDQIRATRQRKDVIETSEGVVCKKYTAWFSEDCIMVAHPESERIELLERPMPKYEIGTYAYIDYQCGGIAEKRIFASWCGTMWQSLKTGRAFHPNHVTRIVPVTITPNESEVWERSNG